MDNNLSQPKRRSGACSRHAWGADFIKIDADRCGETISLPRDMFVLAVARCKRSGYASRGKWKELCEGQVLVAGPARQGEAGMAVDGRISFYCFRERFLLHFAGDGWREAIPPPDGNAGRMEVLLPVGPEELTSITGKIDDYLADGRKLGSYLIANCLVRILLKTGGGSSGQNTTASQTDGKCRMMSRFMHDLEVHMNRLRAGEDSIRYNVRDFARLQRVHENYFSGVISRNSGKRPCQWIAERLCMVAVALLREFTLSVKEVSCRLGFRHVSHFCSFFRKHAGKTPSEYRAAMGLHTL